MEKHKYVTIGIVSFTRRTKEAKFEKQRRLSEKVWYQKRERAENRKWEAKRCIEGTALISMCRVVCSRDICWDGVHLTARGCRKFYEKIAK